jgi:addiction module RelE/StbE family toxin
MKLIAGKSFTRAFKCLRKKNPQLQDRVLEVLELLENNPFAPSLKSHKLTGNLEGYWSCSVVHDCRIIFRFYQDQELGETSIILVDIGSHDQVY